MTALAPTELFKDPARSEHAVDGARHPRLFSPEEITAAAAAPAKAKAQKH